MCTSFISRKEDIIIGMNFDNKGMKFSVNTRKPNQFTIHVDGGRGKYPSFGVNSSGTFINNILVDSNGKGLYRRPSKKVTHTTRLVTDILNGTLLTENLNTYLDTMEIVNIPDWCCHNMICDSNANVWIVEPGRGNLYIPAASSPFVVMTNFSLWDYTYNNEPSDCSRYAAVTDILAKEDKPDIDTAFHILEAAKQSEGEWITEFSMVYSKKAHAVYYCLNGDFNNRMEYKFPV